MQPQIASRNLTQMRPAILQPGHSYTFRQYFEMTYEPEDILGELGYEFQRSTLSLPQSDINLDRLDDLKTRIQESLPYISLTSEAARRELLIAPLLIDVLHYTHAQLRVEYSLNVSEQLKGCLDYYLYSAGKLLIVEAKNADLTRGFTQLAVELIALDIWSTSEEPILHGAVSTGDIWQFGILHRGSKQIQQVLNLYRVPDELESLMRILIKILQP